ncbi:DHA2 family efflux MFS transporter permease subunit [Alicyclobacillus curvatus]|nr:DHA2 family efflux MFS transporter permease subunit [Alicyclobacillus curvatus]
MNHESWQSRHSAEPWYRWTMFATVVTGTFMVNIDSSIMNVAIPVLEREFHAGPQVLQWVISAYLLVITGILPVVGTLSDTMNRKLVFIAGVTVFTVGSILCAFANGIDELIFFRVLQSVGGSIIMGNVMSIVSYIFPVGQRGRPLGLIGSVVAAGTIVGPSLGGIFISLYGWRSIFWVNVPIGIVSVIAATILLVPIRNHMPRRKFDTIGAILFFTGITALMIAISEGQTWGWLSARILAAFMLSVIALGIFFKHELHATNPVIELSLFRSKAFALGNIAGYMSFIMMMMPGFLLPLYMHNVLHISTAHIGLLLTPQAITMVLLSPVGGWMADKYGPKWPATIGLALATAGLGSMAFLSPSSSYVDIVICQAVFGLGMGIFTSPNNVSVLESAPVEKSGLTGSLMAAVRNFGRVSGVALAVLFLQAAGSNLHSSAGFAQASSFAFTMAVIIGLTGTILTTSRLLVRPKRQELGQIPGE